MITEEGYVTQSSPGIARIKTVRNSACAGCAAHGSCEGAKEGEVEAIDELGVRVGDRVVVGFHAGSLVKVSMLLYLFPVVCMIVGAVIGQQMAPGYDMDESAASAIGAFLFFLLSFICIRLTGNRLTGNRKYQARILRIRQRAAIESAPTMETANP